MCMVQQCVASLKFLPAQPSPFVEIFFIGIFIAILIMLS